MKIIEITTCESCPLRINHVCTHDWNTGNIEISMTKIPELCPLPSPQEYQISANALAGIFYILAHDFSVEFVRAARAMDRVDEPNEYRDKLLKMIEWADKNDMCVEERLRHTLYLIDNPEEEI